MRIAFLCLLFYLPITVVYVSAQQHAFPLDEAGNILYYEVVETEGFNSVQLVNNIESHLRSFHGFTEKQYKKQLLKKNGIVSFDSASNAYKSNGKYVVYPGRIIKHATGEVKFEFVVEIKENRYRYYFHNFIYQPYVLNRYGKYVPASGKAIPLNTFSLSKDVLALQEQAKLATYIERQVETLKQAMKMTLTATKKKNGTNKVDSEW